jgi:hypothetical protein
MLAFGFTEDQGAVYKGFKCPHADIITEVAGIARDTGYSRLVDGAIMQRKPLADPSARGFCA